MLGYVVAGEAADIVAAEVDALLASGGSLQGLAEGGGKGFVVVGGDVEVVGTACFFEAGTSAGNDGESAVDGFDDGDAEAFVAGGIDEGVCQGIEDGEVGIADAMEDDDTLLQVVATDEGADAVGIGGALADEDESDVRGEVLQGFDGEEGVLALFDGADTEDEGGVQTETTAHVGDGVGGGFARETGSAALVDDVDGIGGNAAKLDDIALGALADGDDAVGFATGLTKLVGVDLGIEPMVVFGMAQEDEVVDGDDGGDGCLTDASGQLSRESVEEADAVATEVADDAVHAPEVALQAQGSAVGIDELHVGQLLDGLPQVVAARVGSVEEQLTVGKEGGEVGDEGAPVVAESGAVAHDSLGVECYF